ncbi:MAG: AMP-binding protein, partial [Pseudomonadota bacterium]
MAKDSASTDPRIPARERCVTRYALVHWATVQPDKVFAVFEDGESWSYSDLHAKVRRLACGLASQGVERGEHVAVWMFDGKEAILTFFAINYLGAVFVPFNTAYKGGILEHVLDNSDAKLLVAHSQLIPRLADIDTARIERIVCVGEPAVDSSLETVEFEHVRQSEAVLPALTTAIEPWDTQS